MATQPGGISASIRRKLQDGRTPEEIVQDLVAGGLGQASAQRFVDRALAESTAAPPVGSAPVAQPPAHIEAADQSNIATATETPSPLTAGGPKTLWYACGLMCLGIGVTAFSYNSAGPGQPYTILWGPVAVGVFLWGKAVFTSFTNARTVPWVSALVSIGVPIGLTLALTGYIAASEPPATQAATSEFEVFEQTGDGKYVPRTGTKPGVQELLVQFENAESARKKCDATDGLGYMRGEDAIDAVDGLMEHYAFEDQAVQHCIRLAVRKLDSEVKFAEGTAAGSR